MPFFQETFEALRSPCHILNFKVLTLTERFSYILTLFPNNKNTLQSFSKKKKKILIKLNCKDVIFNNPWLVRAFNYIATFVLIGYQCHFPSKEIWYRWLFTQSQLHYEPIFFFFYLALLATIFADINLFMNFFLRKFIHELDYFY